MAEHVKFHYKTLEELKEDIAALGLNIPVSADVSILRQPVAIGDRTLPNRLAIQPMEGVDATLDGRPTELTRRRYRRFAQGGAGLIWFEATAVQNEGRASAHQLCIGDSKDDYAEVLEDSIKAARAAGRERPYYVMQLTHSGRYSRPGTAPAPLAAQRNPYLDKRFPPEIPMRVISDEELERLEDKYVAAAEIAAEAGFDAVDIKACHGYLLGELLTARTREGRYGGSFENRCRALCNIVGKVRAKLGDKLEVAVRVGAYDQLPYPYGFGADKDEYHKPDYREPVRLIKLLSENGVRLLNITIGNPFYNPHLVRPYNQGTYVPPVHPLQGVHLLLDAARTMQAAAPEAVIMSAGLTWLSHFAPNALAGCIKGGWFKLGGFGRQAIAYPDFAADLLEKGAFDRRKTCQSCGLCAILLREGGTTGGTGCVSRDKEVYAPIYKKLIELKPAIKSKSKAVAEHV